MSTGGSPRRATSRGGCASSSTPARRPRARSFSSSRRGRTPSATRRRCALEGLPTYRAAGRGYFGQQQVADLTMYLRLLLNRYDDEALVSVLASPFVGVSNDALYLLRRAAGRRPLFSGMERDLPAGARPARPAPLRGVPAALRPARPRGGDIRPRAALRADRLRARLRPRRPRALGRPAALREPAQARAARALLRGAARARHRGLRPLRRATRRPPAPARARPSPRRRAATPSGS